MGPSARVVVALGLALLSVSVAGCRAPEVASTAPKPAVATPRSVSVVTTDQSVVKSVLPRKSGWVAEGVDAPRYTADGLGIYYVVSWVHRTMPDYRKDDVIRIASIHSKPVVLSRKTAGLPAVVMESVGGGVDRSNGRPDATNSDFLALSPDGRFWIPISGASGPNGPHLWLIGVDKSATRIAKTWDSAEALDAAGWLDTSTVLAGISGLKDGSSALDLVDVVTGKTQTVFRIPRHGEDPTSVERIVVDQEGFVVFTVEDGSDSTVRLYRFDIATRKVTALGRISNSWDYSASRNRIVQAGEVSPRLVERPLPSP